jgi:hypothetical protein
MLERNSSHENEAHRQKARSGKREIIVVQKKGEENTKLKNVKRKWEKCIEESLYHCFHLVRWFIKFCILEPTGPCACGC